MQKTLSFGIPCFNSAEYMNHCISSILEGSDYADDVQVIVVDDGSTKDNTFEIACDWQKKYIVYVVKAHMMSV